MPELARKYESRERYYYGDIQTTRPAVQHLNPYRSTQQIYPQHTVRRKPQPNQKKVNKYNNIHRIISLTFAAVLAFGILPHA